MTKVSSAAYVAAGKTLLGQARKQTIPYVAAGMSLSGMDCQGLAEYLLIQCGVPKAECNLAGSNAHWRNCVWTGTPEQCKAAFGAVPPGAWVFIVSDSDAGAPEKYRGDGEGDAGHMGVYLGDCALHASFSRGCVAESKFVGKTIKNGGWNMIGLPPWVDYGITSESGADASGAAQDAQEGASGSEDGLTIGTPTAPKMTYATVVSPDGNPVKLRKSASKDDRTYWLVNHGASVCVERVKGDWSLISCICSDGHLRRAYMMSRFLRA